MDRYATQSEDGYLFSGRAKGDKKKRERGSGERRGATAAAISLGERRKKAQAGSRRKICLPQW